MTNFSGVPATTKFNPPVTNCSVVAFRINSPVSVIPTRAAPIEPAQGTADAASAMLAAKNEVTAAFCHHQPKARLKPPVRHCVRAHQTMDESRDQPCGRTKSLHRSAGLRA